MKEMRVSSFLFFRSLTDIYCINSIVCKRIGGRLRKVKWGKKNDNNERTGRKLRNKHRETASGNWIEIKMMDEPRQTLIQIERNEIKHFRIWYDEMCKHALKRFKSYNKWDRITKKLIHLILQWCTRPNDDKEWNRRKNYYYSLHKNEKKSRAFSGRLNLPLLPALSHMLGHYLSNQMSPAFHCMHLWFFFLRVASSGYKCSNNTGTTNTVDQQIIYYCHGN